MRWNKVNDHWVCRFDNVPFKVILVDKVEFIKATLLFTEKDFWVKEIATKTYGSVELAKSEVHLFILEHLAQYSAQVHRECLEANVMTWRKLREQLDQIHEDQLDEAIRVLDSEDDWLGEPEIIKAEKDRIKYKDGFKDCTDYVGSWEDREIALEKGKYYLSIKL